MKLERSGGGNSAKMIVFAKRLSRFGRNEISVGESDVDSEEEKGWESWAKSPGWNVRKMGRSASFGKCDVKITKKAGFSEGVQF